MDTPQNFRTAINGFRREDVVSYLEYLNAKHLTEVKRLTADNDALREEITHLMEQHPAQDPDISQELEDVKARLQMALSDKKALEETVSSLQKASVEIPQGHSEALDKAQADNLALRERCEALEKQLSELKEETAQKDLTSQELEAYRRAERAERIANEKADLIYHRANSILDEASGKIDGASADLSELAEKFSSQLQQMQDSIHSSKIALKSAVETMHSLHVDHN